MHTAPDINYFGPDWSLLVEWLKDTQQETYQRIMNINCSDKETEQLRGRALFIEQLLDLGNNPAAE